MACPHYLPGSLPGLVSICQSIALIGIDESVVGGIGESKMVIGLAGIEMKPEPGIDLGRDRRAVVQEFTGAAMGTHIGLQRGGAVRHRIKHVKEGDKVGFSRAVWPNEYGQGAGPEVIQLADGLEPLDGEAIEPGSHIRYVSHCIVPRALVGSARPSVFYSILYGRADSMSICAAARNPQHALDDVGDGVFAALAHEFDLAAGAMSR